MAKKRVNLRAKGEVQKVGYRDFTQNVARKLGIVGYVGNMRDGTVLIVCEGEESSIEEFIKTIKVKKDFIDVEDVNIVETLDPTGEFEFFDIKYGSTEEELGDRMGAGILYMAATRDEVKQVGKKVECVKDEVKASRQDIKEVGQKVEGVSSDIRAMHTDLKEGFAETKEGLGRVDASISSMHTDMNVRFDTLDEKYGAISQQMNVLTTELQKSTNSLVSLTEKIGALIDEKLSK
ncbi:MAG: acylphosphatase [Candidatus Thermoplasmatota archaeon]|nr:hypothetical protein [Euryarchaeota archaeon]MBU4031418.1 acylphosphatase [Candidatus Thermoplasmatota archaeon]MBU4071934.1 acylphosphatase [Candidatus Thermoplasmatota archaeon]MBU4144075.1 acylphosphatase [Candidatus Thermoplasmatota archaeon]MBU4592245.1 acylphosphatase [Candidatus Thermoplasmatota archaeon]